MTRQEYLSKKVEDLVNNDIIPVLKEKEKNNTLSKEEIEKINIKNFLYSVGRVSPLILVGFLSRYLTEEEFNEISVKYNEIYSQKGE